MSFHQIILREVERQGVSGYRLGKDAGLPIRSVQAYLAGDSDMLGERLAAICGVLGLELRRARKSKPRK